MGKKRLANSTYDTIILLGNVELLFETHVNSIKMTGEITVSDQIDVNQTDW